MNKKRWQLKIEAWLDGNKSEQLALYEDIAELKKERSFSRAFRQGIRLWLSLKNRDVSVLLELFPWVKEALQNKNKDTSSNTSDNEGIITDNALKAHIDRLENLIMQQHNTASNASQNAHKPHHATPAYTLNDLPELESKRTKSNEKSSQNLLNALSGITGTEKITIKPAVPKVTSIITDSDKPLAAPTFDNLEI